MNNQPPKLYLDPRSEASLIYNNIGDLFRKEEKASLFLPWKDKPVIIDGEEYFTKPTISHFMNHDIFTRITDLGGISQMRNDIYDIGGRLVLRARDTRMVVRESFMPLVELDILEALIENCLSDASAWINSADIPDPYNIVRSYVISPFEFANLGIAMDYEDWADAGIVRTLHIAEPLLKQVIRYIGEDNYVIHTFSRQGIDFVIEKTIDYRISEYERLKQLGII